MKKKVNRRSHGGNFIGTCIGFTPGRRSAYQYCLSSGVGSEWAARQEAGNDVRCCYLHHLLHVQCYRIRQPG